MTYAMKIQEERDEARAEGITEAIRSLMQITGLTIEKVMEAWKISKENICAFGSDGRG